MNMANKIDFTKKQNLEDNVSSGIRKYIKGEINAEELAQSRKYTKNNLNLHNNNISNNPMSNNTINNNNMNNNNMNNNNMNNYNMNDNMIVTNVNDYNMNNFNFDDELDDTMANINDYLMNNKQYLEQDFNNNYNNFHKPRQSVTPSDLPDNRRKSVNNMISSISLKNFKRNTQILNQTLSQNMRKTLNFSNNNLNLLNSNINRNAQSTDKGRKRYQSVFNNNNSNNYNFPSIDSRNNINNTTLKKSISIESEDSKNSAERKS
jgi:hypothetical protein